MRENPAGGVGIPVDGMDLGVTVVLRGLDDPGHGLDRLHRVVADRGLAGEHHAVRTVENRVRHIGGLGAGGPRGGDHGLQHLGRDNHRLGPLACRANDLFLDQRHVLEREFNTQITASDHESVEGVDDLLEVRDRLRFLQLCDDGNAAPFLIHDLVNPFDVVTTTNEGKRDHVDVLRERPTQIPLVLLTHRRNGDGDPGKVDSLVVGHMAAYDHFAKHVSGRDLQSPQTHLSIIDQDLVPWLHVPGEALEGGGAALLGAENILDGDGETVSWLQEVFLVVGELSKTDLWPLEIGQDAHGAASYPCGFSDGVETVLVLGIVPVAHVETSDIHSGVDELNETVSRIGGRTQSTNDLCSTHAATLPHGLSLTSPRSRRVQGPAATPIQTRHDFPQPGARKPAEWREATVYRFPSVSQAPGLSRKADRRNKDVRSRRNAPGSGGYGQSPT